MSSSTLLVNRFLALSYIPQCCQQCSHPHLYQKLFSQHFSSSLIWADFETRSLASEYAFSLSGWSSFIIYSLASCTAWYRLLFDCAKLKVRVCSFLVITPSKSANNGIKRLIYFKNFRTMILPLYILPFNVALMIAFLALSRSLCCGGFSFVFYLAHIILFFFLLFWSGELSIFLCKMHLMTRIWRIHKKWQWH